MTSRIEDAGRSGPADISEVVDGLNDLLQLDHDAVSAYELACDLLEDEEFARAIGDFQRDHERHIRDLNDLIVQLGGAPRNEPHATGPIKEGIQRISAAGGDRAILTAWRANELQSTAKYDGYARKARFWPPEAKRLVDANALDEERHYQWVAGVLGERDPAEIRIIGRMRERLGLLGPKATAGAAGLRALAADGLARAAGRLQEVGSEGDSDGLPAPAIRGARAAARGLGGAARVLREPESFDARQMLESEIRERPLGALLTTFGIGFVIGRILR